MDKYELIYLFSDETTSLGTLHEYVAPIMYISLKIDYHISCLKLKCIQLGRIRWQPIFVSFQFYGMSMATNLTIRSHQSSILTKKKAEFSTQQKFALHVTPKKKKSVKSGKKNLRMNHSEVSR